MADEVKRTADPGSDPGKDNLTAKVGAEPTKDPEGKKTPDPSAGDKDLPFDKHPKWQSARQAERALDEMKEAFGADSIDDLRELIQAGTKIKGLSVDVESLDKVIEKAKTLERYEAHWKEEEERQRREGEDPSETVRRLEAENRKLKDADRKKEEADKKGQEAKKLWESYDHEVETIIRGNESIPEGFKDVYINFFGVKNPASNVDFRDKKAIRKTVADGVKILDSFRQEVIANYIAGKGEIPKIPSGEVPGEKPTKITGLRHARQIMSEMKMKT